MLLFLCGVEVTHGYFEFACPVSLRGLSGRTGADRPVYSLQESLDVTMLERRATHPCGHGLSPKRFMHVTASFFMRKTIATPRDIF